MFFFCPYFVQPFHLESFPSSGCLLVLTALLTLSTAEAHSSLPVFHSPLLAPTSFQTCLLFLLSQNEHLEPNVPCFCIPGLELKS